MDDNTNPTNPNPNINPGFGGSQNFGTPPTSSGQTPPASPFNQPQPLQQPPQFQPQTPPVTNQSQTPLEPPPPPQPIGGPGQGMVDLPPDQSPLVIEPKKRKFPFLIVIILLIIILLGAVGYFAYQNYFVKNKSISSPTSPLRELPTPQVTPTPQATMKEFKSTILTLSFSVPAEWVVTEEQKPELGNEKKITAQSPDFALQDDQVATGYQLIIGPVSDLTNKYDSFDSFAQAENANLDGQITSINNISWIKYPTSAKTLLNTTPLTITLYSGAAENTQAPNLFTQILSTFKFVEQPQQ